MQRIRGEQVVITPILPEQGDVWPGPQPPDLTLDELARQQSDATGQSSGPAARSAAPPTGAPGQAPVAPSVTVGGGSERGYRHLQGAGAGNASGPSSGQGILVPNGNGTSTMISPDGSIQTVPTPK